MTHVYLTLRRSHLSRHWNLSFPVIFRLLGLLLPRGPNRAFDRNSALLDLNYGVLRGTRRRYIRGHNWYQCTPDEPPHGSEAYICGLE